MEKGEWGRRGGEREWGRRGVRREGESVCEGEREGGKKRGREGGGCLRLFCLCLPKSLDSEGSKQKG